MKARTDPEFHLDFKDEKVQETEEFKVWERWLYSQDVVKAAVQKYMRNMLSTNNREQYIQAIAAYITKNLRSINGYEKAVEDAWEQKKLEIDELYDMGYHVE